MRRNRSWRFAIAGVLVGFLAGCSGRKTPTALRNQEPAFDVAAAVTSTVTDPGGDVKNNAPDAKADNVQQSVTMAKPGRLYEKPDNKSKVVRDLDPGMMLYPSGEKQGIWWKVSDELGNEGWVPSPLFNLAK